MSEDFTVLDYFSGPGGLSEGFREAGYNILLGTDFDENSARTFQTNHPESKFIKEDISELDPKEVVNKIGAEDIDVVIGGPPCQGFSIAGERRQDDERNHLFKDFARHIEAINPEIFVMENVKGLLSMDTPEGNPVINEIQKRFKDIGYNTSYEVLKASDYGTPQHRERVFIIGCLKDVSITFPNPSHNNGEAQEKLDQLNEQLKPHLTVKEAFSDLPRIDPGEQATEYNKKPQNDFQERMRERMTEGDKIKNHDAVNHRDHIIKRFKHIPQGGDMTDAPEKHQPNKVYSSRNRRLDENEPSHTVTSHVLDELLHPWDNRAITVREAARLQGFPDHYEFKGKRNVFHGADETSQYEQVGNAVPVILSEKIAEHIRKKFLE